MNPPEAPRRAAPAPATQGAADQGRAVPYPVDPFDLDAVARRGRPPRPEPPEELDDDNARAGWGETLEQRCAELRAGGRWREPRAFDAVGASGALSGVDHQVTAFASNDYLGLSTHPTVVEAAHRALDRWGAGSGASRLVTGSRPVHHRLEVALARWKGTERAVLFPTGFAANVGVLTTLGGRGVLICSDERNHASIIDGARLARASGAEVAVYRHRDPDHLDALLGRHRGRAIVVSDLVFSMDGDAAPVEALAQQCRRHGALLVLDEAHAVLGPDPALHLEGVEAVRVGTLSKALGSVGGFVACAAPVAALLENTARPYIFSTAPPPADAAAALAALRLLQASEGWRLVERLRRHVEAVAPGHPSPIIPVVLGDEAAALAASAALLERGLWVPAIRPPSVPPGTARLRVSLSAAHLDAEVGRLRSGLTEVLGFPAGPGPARTPG